MATTTTSLNPSLLAILLVTQSRTGSGAEIVFHYPPDPLSPDRISPAWRSTDDDEAESSSSDSGESSSEEDFELFTKGSQDGAAPSAPVTAGSGSRGDRSQRSDDEDEGHMLKQKSRDDGGWKPQWEPLLGLGEDGLANLLAPGRAWHKRKFELGINDFTFLGRPVYAREDGVWRKPKSKKSSRAEDDSVQQSIDTANGSDSDKDEEAPADDETHVVKDKAETKEHRAVEPPKSQLTMFHAVFVMDPPPLEHTLRVKDMYDHVARKMSKVLKWEQSHHDYVWEQSELMHSIKASHFQQKSPTKALYTELLRRSSLAAAMAKVFDNISASRIAAITLSSKLSVSFQIPPVTSTSYLPSLSEPPLEPGVWLTTATDPASTADDLDSTSSGGALQVSKNFTLLFKSSPQKILKDIQAAGGPLALPLANFMAKATPTKSFYKISIASQMALGDIQHLARHLVYWRRAIAIPPLHQRDTYIVSPNANMSKLVSACKSYEATFPMMPSLPKMLNSLSGTPVPYGTLIPSSDHKEEYYRVLAWLMRDGWVTQLRTFAFVRVGPEVKKAVREREKEEIFSRRSGGAPPTPAGDTSNNNNNGLDSNRNGDVAQSFGSGTPTTVASGSLGISTSFRQRPSMVSRPSSDGHQSISTDHTSGRVTQQLKHDPKAASLVLSPQRASPEESRWLDYIGSTLVGHTETETAELRRYWPIFVKYFTGSEALERIAVREGLKRKFVWDMLVKMGLNLDGGVEDDKGENKRVLVAIRHW
ncbi:Nitrogen permease regulator 3 [Exophiala dermatitidis]